MLLLSAVCEICQKSLSVRPSSEKKRGRRPEVRLRRGAEHEGDQEQERSNLQRRRQIDNFFFFSSSDHKFAFNECAAWFLSLSSRCLIFRLAVEINGWMDETNGIRTAALFPSPTSSLSIKRIKQMPKKNKMPTSTQMGDTTTTDRLFILFLHLMKSVSIVCYEPTNIGRNQISPYEGRKNRTCLEMMMTIRQLDH